jgi:hypothetical protein
MIKVASFGLFRMLDIRPQSFKIDDGIHASSTVLSAQFIISIGRQKIPS